MTSPKLNLELLRGGSLSLDDEQLSFMSQIEEELHLGLALMTSWRRVRVSRALMNNRRATPFWIVVLINQATAKGHQTLR